MNNAVIVIFVIVLIGQFIYQILLTKKRKQIEENITNSIIQGNFHEFHKIIDQRETCKYIPIFNRLYLKMNVAFLQGDDNKLNETFDLMRKMKLSVKQKEDVFSKAFNYYVEKGDKKKSEYYKDQILEISKNVGLRTLTKKTYSVMIEKSDEYLQQLLKENEELKGNKRLSSDILLSKIYENKGDEILAKKYLDQYKNDAKA